MTKNLNVAVLLVSEQSDDVVDDLHDKNDIINTKLSFSQCQVAGVGPSSVGDVEQHREKPDDSQAEKV